MLVGIRFLPTVYYAMLGVLIPLLINDVAGNKSTVAAYASISLIVASTAQLVAGRSADRFGRRVPVLAGFGALDHLGAGAGPLRPESLGAVRLRSDGQRCGVGFGRADVCAGLRRRRAP